VIQSRNSKALTQYCCRFALLASLKIVYTYNSENGITSYTGCPGDACYEIITVCTSAYSAERVSSSSSAARFDRERTRNGNDLTCLTQLFSKCRAMEQSRALTREDRLCESRLLE
jgi:hypothetical protein